MVEKTRRYPSREMTDKESLHAFYPLTGSPLCGEVPPGLESDVVEIGVEGGGTQLAIPARALLRYRRKIGEAV